MNSTCRRCSVVIVTVLLVISSILPVHATGEAPPGDGQSVLNFAGGLYDEQDYYRAVTEFKRFLFHFPHDREGCERAHFYLCRSYFEASRWNDALESCHGFILNYPGSNHRGEVYFLKGLCEKKLKRYNDALRSFSESAGASERFRDRAVLEQALVFVEQEQWGRAGELSAGIGRESPLYLQAAILSEGMRTVETLPRKSPLCAGLFAAVLPGSGHLYTERPRDALVAFLLNASFLWAAVELFQDEHYVAGGVLAFFEAGWYAGNIYSAVGSAHKFNRDRKDQFLRVLKEKTELPHVEPTPPS